MKKSIIPVAAFIAGMAIVPSVFAADDYDNSKPITTWEQLQACLQNDEETYCSAAQIPDDGVIFTDNNVVVATTKTLDLAGKTLTVRAESTKVAIEVPNKTSLTIKNGVIDDKAGAQATIVVDGGGNLALNGVDVKAVNSALYFKEANGAQSTITVDADSALETTGNFSTVLIENAAGARKSTVNIAGDIDSSAQIALNAGKGGNFDITLSGTVNSDSADAITLGAGTLILNGATVNASASDKAAVSMFAGSVLRTQNCATVTGSSAAIYVTGAVKEINLNKSTLISLDGSVFAGKGEVETVKIAGSHLVAADDETKVKGGDIDFKTYDYDGKEHSDVQLSQTDGSYGENVTCDAAADEGEEENKGEEAENPNTADTIATYMTIAAVALLGLGATAFVAKKSNR